MKEIEHDSTNPKKVSAFAVYKNLIPGVRTYEDTNSPTVPGKKKKRRNRKGRQVNAALKQELSSPVLSPSPSSEEMDTKKKRKRKRNKKRKLEEGSDEVEVIQSDEVESPSQVEEVIKSKKKKKKTAPASPEMSEIEELIPTSPSRKQKMVQVEIAKVNGVKEKSKKQQHIEEDSEEESSSPLPPRSSLSLFSSEPIKDSVLHGKTLFEWLIHPTPIHRFFSENWEKKPLHVKRLTQPHYYGWIMSSSTLDEIMKKNVIKFGKNVDITSYVDGVRETHNPEGRALPPVVWDYYSNGCSVRFLNPQTYIKPLWRLNASLQEYIGTFVGANAYLTPPDSQGFAPHYDDIEAFVIQIEGSKQWKLYKPRTKTEVLPRFSSQNFNEETDDIGTPILNVLLRPGDLLYFPRGTIHQAKAVEGEHSLHITISAYQTNSYADFLKMYLPLALEQSISENLELRRGLPLDYLSYMGVVHSEQTDTKIVEKREAFEKKIKKMAEGLLNKSCDLAADQMGKKLIWDSLPPYFTSQEKRRSVYGDGEFIHEGSIINRTEIGPDVEVKFIRRNACRLVIEEDSIRLYFSLENSLEYHGEEAQYLELPDSAGPAIEHLFNTYPEFTKIEHLPLQDEALKVQLAADMWEKGLLVTKTHLNPFLFDEDSFETDGSLESASSEEVSEEEEEEEEADREFIDDDESESASSEESEENTPPPRLVKGNTKGKASKSNSLL